MRVVCAYTSVHPLAEASLERYAPEVEYVDVATSDTAYCKVLTDLWAGGEDVLVVEHDIEIHDRVVPEARACSEPWCVWPYNGPGFGDKQGDPFLYGSLGCTRFSGVLMRTEPDLLAVAGALSQGLPAGDWRRMDASILPTLRDRGYEPHLHWPAVLHHHIYPNEGCACGSVHEEAQ